jgi:hypothetical protein
MIISIDVLDMGDMMSLLDYLRLVFGVLANGILQFNHNNLFSDNVDFDLEVF